jgi:hypothetical protein
MEGKQTTQTEQLKQIATIISAEYPRTEVRQGKVMIGRKFEIELGVDGSLIIASNQGGGIVAERIDAKDQARKMQAQFPQFSGWKIRSRKGVEEL